MSEGRRIVSGSEMARGDIGVLACGCIATRDEQSLTRLRACGATTGCAWLIYDRATGLEILMTDATQLRALIQEAEWAGEPFSLGRCPWCDGKVMSADETGQHGKHRADCPAALAMNWKRAE